MNKYDIELEELKIEWDAENKKYAAEAQQINNMAMQFCNKFNSQITIVNVERHLMRKEISALYKFLKQFGDVGEKLTPFDFVVEDWLFPGANTTQNIGSSKQGTSRNPLDFSAKGVASVATAGATVMGVSAASGLLGVSTLAGSASIAASAATVGMALPVFAPIALPAYMLVSGLKKKADSKEELMKNRQAYEQDCIRWKNDIAKAKDEVSFFATSVEIADMYRVLVATVRDTIAEKIIPELNGILAFLYADAIKNCIINNEDPSAVRIGSIAEYRGTPYEGHYTFIRNVFDYYSLITTFFAEPVLSNLLQKRKVSESDLKRFEKKIKNIGEQQLKLTDGVILGGEQ